jgi:ABC-type uncharacterized transport system involved in gliding motility auxiliary subunit
VRTANGLLGLLGLIFLAFAGIAFYLTRGATRVDQLFIAVHGIAGLLSFIAFLSTGIESLRGFVGERSTKYGASTVLSTVFFIGILVAANYLSTRYHHKFDLTEAGVFSLSPQSAQVVKLLDKDLKLQAFVEGGVAPELRDLLNSYHDVSPKVTYQLIDPDRQPELAEQYKITAYNTVRLEYGDSSTTVSQPTEEAITNAIIKVTRSQKKTVCFIEGHGEPDPEDMQEARGFGQAKAALANENYEVKKVLLLSQEKVPDDCALVIVAGPVKPYQEQELTALDTFLRNGGRVLFLVGPRSANEFQPLLAKWGVKLGDDVVVDQVLRLFQGPALGLAPLVETYTPHEITKDFKGRTVFPMTRSVQADAQGKAGLQVTELAKSGPSSWAETDLNALFEQHTATKDGADRPGPIPIATVVLAKLKEMGEPVDKEARLAVFGSAQFIDNRNLDGTFYNRDLFLNTVGWLAGEADLLSIRPRALRASQVQFTRDQGTLIFYLSVLIVPELLLIAGLVVWWRRE